MLAGHNAVVLSPHQNLHTPKPSLFDKSDRAQDQIPIPDLGPRQVPSRRPHRLPASDGGNSDQRAAEAVARTNNPAEPPFPQAKCKLRFRLWRRKSGLHRQD